MDDRRPSSFEHYRLARSSFDSDLSNTASDQAYSPYISSNVMSTQPSTDSGSMYPALHPHSNMGADPLQMFYDLPDLQLMDSGLLMPQHQHQQADQVMHELYTMGMGNSANLYQSYLVGNNDADLYIQTQNMVDAQYSPKAANSSLVDQSVFLNMLNHSPRRSSPLGPNGSPTLANQHIKASPTLAQRRLKASPVPASRLNSNASGHVGADRSLRRSFSAHPIAPKGRMTVSEKLSNGSLHSQHTRDMYLNSPIQPRHLPKHTPENPNRPRVNSMSAASQRSTPRPLSFDPTMAIPQDQASAPPYYTQNALDYTEQAILQQLKRHPSDPILGNYSEQHGFPSPQQQHNMLTTEQMNKLGLSFDQVAITNSPIQVAQQLVDEGYISPEQVQSTLHALSPQMLSQSLGATPSSWNDTVLMTEAQYNSIGLPASLFFNVHDHSMHGSPRVSAKHSPHMAERSLSMVRSVSGKSSMETMLITLSTHCKWYNCGLVFATFQEFQEHLETVHVGSRKPTYECYWHGCSRNGKSFNKRVKIISHLRTHTGERPFICDSPGCLKSFKRHDALENHKKTHTGKPEFKCRVPTCRKEYYHEKSLKKHHKKEHPDAARTSMDHDDDEDDDEEYEEDEE
jgi:hypothetical protein